MLISRDFEFQAAHQLINYKGKIEKLHGHSWKLRVTLNSAVDEDGMAFDFVELKKIVEDKILFSIDNSNLNELLTNPTAENLAIWVWQNLKELPLYEISVWETKDAFVTYRGEVESGL